MNKFLSIHSRWWILLLGCCTNMAAYICWDRPKNFPGIHLLLYFIGNSGLQWLGRSLSLWFFFTEYFGLLGIYSWWYATVDYHINVWITASVSSCKMQNSIFRSEDTITLCTTFATVSCAMVAFSLPIEGKRLPGRILIFTVCLTGKIFEILELFQFDLKW